MFESPPSPAIASAGQQVLPDITFRPATSVEASAAQLWVTLMAPGSGHPDVAEFADGTTLHAPEVIAAYREAAAMLPGDFCLLYLHRGAQAQCQNPLLPSLLFLTAHKGPAHALRRDGCAGIDRDVLRFAQAVAPASGAVMILDDPQIRLGPSGQLTRTPVQILCLFNRTALPATASGDFDK